MAEVDLAIVGRSYRVACRSGEEDTLRAAAALVDGKSREALAGLGALSESRQLLFASLQPPQRVTLGIGQRQMLGQACFKRADHG